MTVLYRRQLFLLLKRRHAGRTKSNIGRKKKGEYHALIQEMRLLIMETSYDANLV